jgi:transposase-like protein
MTSVRALAAANNAAWCDAVCRTHGLDPVLERDAWTSHARTPLLYPDAVTLTADVCIAQLLERVDGSAGCSIKDSFASLDLTPSGFRVLLDAQWIVQTLRAGRPAPATPTWRVVGDTDAFETWRRAWERDIGAPDVLTADLLAEEAVLVLAGHLGDTVVAGAVLTCSAHVVGISNFFEAPGAVGAGWDGCLAMASTLFPDQVLVGYESGDSLDVARAHGFSAAGPLRVWVRQG